MTILFYFDYSYTNLSDSKHVIKSSYHIWFQVECEVDIGPPDCSVSVSCEVFSKKIIQLSVNNPYSDTLTLNVSY